MRLADVIPFGKGADKKTAKKTRAERRSTPPTEQECRKILAATKSQNATEPRERKTLGKKKKLGKKRTIHQPAAPSTQPKEARETKPKSTATKKRKTSKEKTSKKAKTAKPSQAPAKAKNTRSPKGATETKKRPTTAAKIFSFRRVKKGEKNYAQVCIEIPF